MGALVDLRTWRRKHGVEATDTVRLERAVGRLDQLAAQALAGGRALDPTLETELLAIIGELSVGLLEEASSRAERLADRLARARRTGVE
jgi:hypothetical protein